MLVVEFLVIEWTEMFGYMDESELEDLACSFKFENCEKREGLSKACSGQRRLVLTDRKSVV